MAGYASRQPESVSAWLPGCMASHASSAYWNASVKGLSQIYHFARRNTHVKGSGAKRVCHSASPSQPRMTSLRSRCSTLQSSHPSTGRTLTTCLCKETGLHSTRTARSLRGTGAQGCAMSAWPLCSVTHVLSHRAYRVPFTIRKPSANLPAPLPSSLCVQPYRTSAIKVDVGCEDEREAPVANVVIARRVN